MILDTFIKKASNITIGKRLIIGSNVLIFLCALLIVNTEVKTTPRYQPAAPVSTTDMIAPIKTGDESASSEEEELPVLEKASTSYQKNIWETLRPWEKFIIRYCREFGVDSDLVRAVLYTESKGDPYSVSPKGALGLMQITQATADFMEAENIYDPEENIKTGVKYIAWLIKKYDETTALMAYNAGIGMLEQDRIPSETRNFIERVQKIKKMLKDQKTKTI